MAANNGVSSEPLSPASRRRSIGLILLTRYGFGTILGAGIYLRIDEVVRVAGPTTAVAFLLAGTLVLQVASTIKSWRD